MVFKLQSYDNCKCCVASRPEVQLINRLAHCEQLRLQDLNRRDIRRFVQQKLWDSKSKRWFGDSTTKNISEAIVARAEGVFLWAALITQAVLRGIGCADTVTMLWERVEAAPKGMNDLFAAMLGNVNEVHKRSLAFYLQVARLSESRTNHLFWDDSGTGLLYSICTLTAANMDGEIDSYEAFAQLCQRTEMQIAAQSAGILEVHDMGRAKASQSIWESSLVRTVRSAARESELRAGRTVCADSTPYPTMLRYESRKITWVHRSAYDFVYGPNARASDSYAQGDLKETILRIWTGALKYFRGAPSCNDPTIRRALKERWMSKRTLAGARLRELVISGLAMHAKGTVDVMLAMNELRLSAMQLIPEDIQGLLETRCNSKWCQIIVPNAFWCEFLGAVTWHHTNYISLDLARPVWGFITGHIDDIVDEPPGSAFAMAALEFLASSISALSTRRPVKISAFSPMAKKLLEMVARRFRSCCKRNAETLFERKVLFRETRRSNKTIEAVSCVLPASEGRSLSAKFDKVAISSFAKAYSGWYCFIRESTNFSSQRDPSSQLAFQVDSMSTLFDEIAEAVELHLAPGIFGVRPKVLLQLSADLWKAAISHVGVMGDLVQADETGKYPQGLRVDFVVDEEVDWAMDPRDLNTRVVSSIKIQNSINMKPPMQAVRELLRIFIKGEGEGVWKVREDEIPGAAIHDFVKALMQDVYANEQGLTATEQRRVLVCIQENLRMANEKTQSKQRIEVLPMPEVEFDALNVDKGAL